MPKIILAVAVWVLIASQADAAMTAPQLASLLKNDKVVDSKAALEIMVLSDELIVSVKTDAELPLDAIKNQAAGIAKVVEGDQGLRSRRLRVIFSSRTNEDLLKEVSIGTDQLGANLDATRVTVVTGEKAQSEAVHIVGGWSTLPPGVKPLTGSEFSPARDKLVTRIKELQTKGVGVKPFFDELGKADDFYKKADMREASVALQRVDNIVGEQEQNFKDRQKALNAAGQGHAKSSAASGSASNQGRGMSLDSLAEFSGSSNAYREQVAREMLRHELGDLAPCEGPFRLERFRIAKRIQEYQARGMNVESYKTYFKKVEEITIASNQDKHRLSELGDNIRYLERQLGLSEFQGGATP